MNLCAIPGCRIRGRHLPSCAVDDCPGCLPRTTSEGHACTPCVMHTDGQLTAIAELAPDARLVAAGLARADAGLAIGKPASRPPLNPDATDAVHHVQNRLTTLARDIAATRGLTVPDAGARDPIVVAARWLRQQRDWIRHAADGQGEPYAVAAYAEIRDCASRLRSVANGPGEQRYLGPCGAELRRDYEPAGPNGGITEIYTCDGDVRIRPGASKGCCRTCKTEYDQRERRIWLDGQVRSSDLVWTARGIADALDINVKTVRGWATQRVAPNGVILQQARLGTFWRDGDRLVPWAEPRPGEDVKARGERLHYVADVIELAQQAAAERERRAAAREAAEMGA